MIDWDDIQNRAIGAYLGLAVGDALGATVEFMTPGEIQESYGVHRKIIGGGWLKLKPGQITDDTGMSLALGDSILAGNGFNTKAAADAFVIWLKSKPVDCGATCRRGIRRYMLEGSIEGPPNEGDAGNGACMRNLPVAIATLGNDVEFTANTLAQCHITHNNPHSDAASLALGQMTQQLLLGNGITACRYIANNLLANFPLFRFDPYPKRTSPYIVDTVQTVLYFFFRTDNFDDCVTQAVNQGGDADTIGALAGMLCGAAYGVNNIPSQWLNKLDPQAKSAVENQTLGLLKLARDNLKP